MLYINMTVHNYRSRLSMLRDAFQEKGLDGILVNSLNDIYYYTGKEISKEDFGFLLVTRGSSTLFVSTLNNDLDGPGVKIVGGIKEIRDSTKSLGRIGYDEKNMSVLLFKKLKTGSWTPFSDTLKSIRMLKDSYEIEQIRSACRSTLKIFKSLSLHGKTEFDIATDILINTRSMGLIPSFDPVVLGGRNSSFIHKTPTKNRVTRGLVIVDMGVCQNKYKSDLTRTFPMNPNSAETSMLHQCTGIQSELIDLVKPGTPFSDIQKRFEELMKNMGHRVLHGFGHGVGLSVHERPGIKDTLEKGMVLTVEPGIYKKGVGGCRIEDMVLVSDNPVILSK
jgi:Xaa-Pro aminopeptidase